MNGLRQMDNLKGMTGMMMEYIRKSVVMPEDDMINSNVQGSHPKIHTHPNN
jgi:hypothetical protein